MNDQSAPTAAPPAPVRPSRRRRWLLRSAVALALAWSVGCVVVGIVNVTPDSFSDGGEHADTDSAIAHGLKLLEEGADMLDIGGESTRPGAAEVGVDEELARVIPVIEGLAAAGAWSRWTRATPRSWGPPWRRGPMSSTT